jgi:hypothetical protein
MIGDFIYIYKIICTYFHWNQCIMWVKEVFMQILLTMHPMYSAS